MMDQPAQLRSGSLSFVEVLATSIALIGPSMTPVLIAPFMFANAGNGTWLAYVFGGVMLTFVALNINQFARRSTGAGSMYEYAAANLGPLPGALAGWILLWSYVFVAAAVLGAMALFVELLLGALGVSGSLLLHLGTVVVIAAICWQAAFRGVQVSAIVMLVLEAISVTIILGIVVTILAKHGWSIDPGELRVTGGIPNWGLAIATAVFSLVGFESATAFGAEASRPLVTIPRAVLWSVALASLFFIVTTYAEILGFAGSGKSLAAADSPLGDLATLFHAGYLRIPITLGALCSAFSVCLACVTASGRILYAMAGARLFPPALGKIEPRHGTPHVAVSAIVAVTTLIAVAALLFGVHPIDVFNDCGTLSSFGFIVIYAVISFAALVYVRRLGELRFVDGAVAVVAVVLLIVPAVTLVYPVPPPPQRWYACEFVAYLAIGAWWFARRRRRVEPA